MFVWAWLIIGEFSRFNNQLRHFALVRDEPLELANRSKA